MYSTLSRACYNCPHNYTDCLRENCILADGKLKTIEVVNKLLPGPSIQVCKGDTVIVNLENKLRSQRVTNIHWHGLRQHGTPYMDGVGMVTQWPIMPFLSYQYKFIADDPGTHLWHSHSGIQRSAGVFGAIVVREDKTSDINGHLYDYDLKEHYILAVEWTMETLQSYYGPYLHATYLFKEHNILINGKAAISEAPELNVPLETFVVEKGNRYRFRFINAAVEFCMFSLSIDGHNLTLIASDGQPMEPIEVESFVSGSGERYDFVLNANQPERDYWMKIRGEGNCYHTNISQRAILRYERSDLSDRLSSNMTFEYSDSTRHGLQFRTYPSAFSKESTFLLSNARYGSDDRDDYFNRIANKPDRKLFLHVDLITVLDQEIYQRDLYNLNDSVYPWRLASINRIKFQTPKSPPLLNSIFDRDQFCNSTEDLERCPDQTLGFCECTHLIELKLGDLIELILIDGGSVPEAHTIHLHGHNFAVIGAEKIIDSRTWNSSFVISKEMIIEMDARGELKRNFDKPVIKDTIGVPLQGYAILRFFADNPGYWILHCHLESHSDGGMALIFKVGDVQDMPPKPSNFQPDFLI